MAEGSRQLTDIEARKLDELIGKHGGRVVVARAIYSNRSDGQNTTKPDEISDQIRRVGIRERPLSANLANEIARACNLNFEDFAKSVYDDRQAASAAAGVLTISLDDRTLDRLSLISPDDRKFFRRWQARLRSEVKAGRRRKAQTGKSGQKNRSSSFYPHLSFSDQRLWARVTPDNGFRPQAAVARAHAAVCEWLKRHDQWNDDRPNERALDELKSIAAELKLRLPLLYDVALELRQSRELPELHHEDVAALQVPLLEPEGELKTGEPLKLRAFMGWLKIEKAPVPKWDDGSRLWEGGHVYSAPVFALLDKDEDWANAFKTAEQFVRSLVPKNEWPTGHDFRWSLARTDGGVLPPFLFGDHIGAAFALALAKIAHVPSAGALDFNGVAVCASIRNDGRLESAEGFSSFLVAAREPRVPAIVTFIVARSQPGLTESKPDDRCRVDGFASLNEAIGELSEYRHTRERWPGLHLGQPPIFPEQDFVPRTGHARALDEFLTDPNGGFLEIRLDVGEGKTTFLHHVVREAGRLESPIAHFASISGRDTPGDVASSLAARLRRKYGLVPTRDEAETASAQPETDLSRVLDQVARRLPADGCEVLYLDAADQVSGLVLPGVFHQRLPERIRVVITTRPHTAQWRLAPGERHRLFPNPGDEAAEAIAQRRNDIAGYFRELARRRYHLGDARFGDKEFIHAVCRHLDAAPFFKTVTDLVRRARKDLTQPLDPARFRLPPRELLLTDLDDAARRLTTAQHSVAEEDFWRELALFAIWRDEQGVTQGQLRSLNLWRDQITPVVLRETANLFYEPGSEHRYRLRHPDNHRLILGELTNEELRELGRPDQGVGLAQFAGTGVSPVHRELALGLLRCLETPDHPAAAYAEEHLIHHLREGGCGRELADWLLDLTHLQTHLTP